MKITQISSNFKAKICANEGVGKKAEEISNSNQKSNK